MRYVSDNMISIFDLSPIWSRSFFSTAYGLLKRRKENTSLIKKFLDELYLTHKWSLSRLEQMQNEKMINLVKHSVKNVEYYEKLFVDYGINTTQIQNRDDLKKIPKLNKNIIKREGYKLIARNIRKEKIREECTSGTTGTPLTIWKDEKTYLYSYALRKMQQKWAGYQRSDWMGILSGYKVISLSQFKPPFWIKNYLDKQIHFSTYHLTPEYISFYIDAMKHYKVRYLLGYPSAVGLLARFILELKKVFPIKAVFLGSEPLLQWQRDDIKKAFDCKIYDFYGQTEGVITAINCNSSEKLHTIMELGILELERQKKSEKHFRIIGTSLTNYAMPLIRYELNDLTSGYDFNCRCGVNRLILNPIETKMEDFILTKNGAFVSASLLTFPFKTPKGIIEAQIIQNNRNEIIVRIVANEFFTVSEERNLVNNIKNCIGDGMRIFVHKVNKIARTANGKFRFVISEVSKAEMNVSVRNEIENKVKKKEAVKHNNLTI